MFVFVWDARLTARRARSNDARVAMAFALDRSSIPLDPPVLADYEGSARRALDDARALAEPEGQPTTEEMSSQLLRTSGGASPRTRVALPRQRRPLHEHDDPETTFMREFEVRPGPRVASRASSRPHPRASTEDSKPFARPTWMLTSEPRNVNLGVLLFQKKPMTKKKAYRAARGDAFAHVTHVLNRRLQRTGKPFDMHGLYRAVCVRGGFGSRPLARKNLNMLQVFREMRNHYDGHTYTDIGTQLLNTYELYFLDYERDHPQDLNVTACARCGRAPPCRPPEPFLAVTSAKAKAKEETAKDDGERVTNLETKKEDAPRADRGADRGAVAAPAKPASRTAPFASSGLGVSGGVAWAREGTTDADLRAVSANAVETKTNAAPGEKTFSDAPERFLALLPLGWVECDACRVLTHVACARDGAADITPGGHVAWFVCDACDAKARGVPSPGPSPPIHCPKNKKKTGGGSRGKSPLGSRSRASTAREKREGQTKRDRDGREVRPNFPSQLQQRQNFSFRTRAAYPGPGPGHFSPNAFQPRTSQNGAYGDVLSNLSFRLVDPRAVYGDAIAYDALQRERESAAAAAAAAAMEMEMERARASYAETGLHTPPATTFPAQGAEGPGPGGAVAMRHARRALGSVPGARLRRSNSAQNILNAAASLPAARSGGADASPRAAEEPPDSRNVDALTRSASQCSLGAEDYWRGLLDANPATDDAENGTAGEGGADLFAFA